MNARSPSLLDSRFSLAWCMSKRYIPILFAFTLHRAHVLLLKFQVANILLISNKISINKNKQIYLLIFLYWCFICLVLSSRQPSSSCLLSRDFVPGYSRCARYWLPAKTTNKELYNKTTKQLYNYTTRQLYNYTTRQLYNKTTNLSGRQYRAQRE